MNTKKLSYFTRSLEQLSAFQQILDEITHKHNRPLHIRTIVISRVCDEDGFGCKVGELKFGGKTDSGSIPLETIDITVFHRVASCLSAVIDTEIEVLKANLKKATEAL